MNFLSMRSCHLQLLIIGTFLSLSIQFVVPLNLTTDTQSNIKDPIIYNRLRHDHEYLQLFRKYQLKHPYEERPIQIKVNITLDQNKTKTVSYTYYENNQIESTSITQDDLILEALDRTYKTRLIPAYIYNYDNPNDRIKASDPNIVAPARCQREMDYLMEKLSELEASQSNQYDPSVNPEVSAFFDSFASEEPGLLFGNYHWTGNWRQCNKRLIFEIDRSNSKNVTSFKGRYCIASIKSRLWNSKIKEKVDELLIAGNHFKYPEQQYDYARFFRIQVGICIPESCDSRVIDQRHEHIRRLALHRLNEPFKSYKLDDLFCLPDETSELRSIEFGGKLLLFLTFVWCSAILIFTYIDYKQSKTKLDRKTVNKSTIEKLVSSMSLIQNYERIVEMKSLNLAYKSAIEATNASRLSNKPALVGTSSSSKKFQQQTTEEGSSISAAKVQVITSESKQAPSDLIFLNSFKVISMFIILYGHVGMLAVHLNRFPLDFDSLDSNFVFHTIASTPIFVDWYFVITGFITAYLAFITKKVEKNSLFQWAHTIFHRYWRLAPMYILLFWFSRSLFHHTASGPVWDYGTNNMTLRSICRRESWLWPITLTSNFHPIHEECIMPAWYIANDMQFYIITPLILICLHKWPISGWIMTLSLIFASISLRIHRYLTDPRAQPLELMRPRYDLYMRNNWDMHPTYIYPQYRIATYLIGILAGHYTYMVLGGKWRSPLYLSRFPQFFKKNETKTSKRFKIQLRTAAWLFGFQIILSMSVATWLISDLFPSSLEPQVKYFTALIYGFDHSITAFGLALMFVTIMMGQFPKIKEILSHPIWTLISRFNYFVFLVQVEVIYWLHQSSERIVDTSVRELIKNWIQLTAICYALSAIVTLFLEYPLATLEREFIGSWVAKIGRKPGVGGITTEGDRIKSSNQEQARKQCQQEELLTLTSHNDNATNKLS